MDESRRLSSRPVSERIVATVAAETGVNPTQLDPLYYYVDPESLDRLFATDASATDHGIRNVHFYYDGHHVTVRQDESVEVVANRVANGESTDGTLSARPSNSVEPSDRDR